MAEGKTELLLWLDIIKKLDITVVFGSDHFRDGQGELEMVTYNGERRCVLPLVPTACAFGKLDGYFLENAKSAPRGFASAGRFLGVRLEVREVTKSKSQRSQGKVENTNRLFRKWKRNPE